MSESLHPAPGQVIGRYRIEKMLGAGGMGVVMAAQHVDIGRRVAIKFMLREVASNAANNERFARESRAALLLKSDHVGHVLDVGESDGAPYMVMELLEGTDLDDLVRKGPVAFPLAVDYVLQACEAVAEAHALGIIHRDLKPKNMFLTRTLTGAPCVKVLDFGLAKMLHDDERDVSLTESHAIFGSPQYMSPEQMKATKYVDARTDIWALGVTLYELLTGSVPFAGATMPEICAAVLKDHPPPPSASAKDVPARLDAIVLRCLEKDPAQRYARVSDLAAALEPFGMRKGALERLRAVEEAALAIAKTIPDAPPPVGQDQKTLIAGDPRDRSAGRVRWTGIAIAAGFLGLAGVGLIAMATLMRPTASTTDQPVAKAPAPTAATEQAPVDVTSAHSSVFVVPTATVPSSLPTPSATVPRAATQPQTKPHGNSGSAAAPRPTVASPLMQTP